MTNPLSFDDLQTILHQRIAPLPDHRKPSPNTRYTIQDAVCRCLWHLLHPIAVVFRVPTPAATHQRSQQRPDPVRRDTDSL